MNHEAVEELKKLNEKIDGLARQLEVMTGHLQVIAINTKGKPFASMGSSVRP
jgi:hypothetical protein